MELCGISLGGIGDCGPRKHLFPRLLSDRCASTDFLYKFVYFKLIFYCQSSSQKGIPVGGGRGSGRGDGKPFRVDCTLAGCYGLC